MFHTANKTNNVCQKKIEKVKNSKEYIQNKMQIDCIKDILINHADVPEKLLDWLIEATEKNAILISEAKQK